MSFQYKKIIQNLISKNKKEINSFLKQLDSSILRLVSFVRIFNLYGKYNDYYNITDAVKAIKKCPKVPDKINFIKFEIVIKFDNEDRVEGQFFN